MRKATLKINKLVSCRVIAGAGEVKIKFPKQYIGSVAIYFVKADGTGTLIRQYSLQLNGDDLKTERLK